MLGLASREELYDRLTPDQHREWVEYFQLTGFTPLGLRLAVAQLSAIVVNFANGFADKDKRPPQVTAAHMVIPQPQAKELKSKENKLKQLNQGLRNMKRRS